MKCNIEKLFCKNKVKEWATEQHRYSQSKLEEVKHLLANVNIKNKKLLIAKNGLCQVFKGIPNTHNRTRKVIRRTKERLQKERQNASIFP